MNILFFLKPKSEVAFIYDYSTLRQVLETMEFHKYASIPMLNKAGEYVGTMTERRYPMGNQEVYESESERGRDNFYPGFSKKSRL